MNTKRIIFWAAFVIILALIVWGMIVAMNKPAGLPGLSSPSPVTATDHVTGSSTAPVTLIEYSDFQCPACGAYYPVIERLMKEASSTMRLVYRHFPLSQHKNALLAAEASEAASKQGKFWEMYRLLFENQASWSDLSNEMARSTFTSYAGRIGLNSVSFAKDIDSADIKKIVDNDQDGGIHIGINATPTFFVNGTAIQNPQNYEDFKTIIDSAAQRNTN